MIIWAPEAIADLREIWDFAGEKNSQAANRLIDAIRAKSEYLTRLPRLGPPGRSENSRMLIVVGTPYFIVYRLTGTDIEIARIIHTARDWPRKP